MYIKRESTRRNWPIPRKGTKYVIAPSHSKKLGIPILVLLRDLLKLVKTRRELKKLLIEKKVLVNGKPVYDPNYSLLLFDKISLPSVKKYFTIVYSTSGKISVKEITENESKEKIVKVVNKRILKGKKIQLNFSDGRNFISNQNIGVGDSVIYNFSKKLIDKVLPMKEKSHVLVIKGKHTGKIGTITKIDGGEINIKIDEKDLMIKENEIIVIN
ncbi:MAG: S4 domain-containing protein [Candidatus Pacearchaeota archaeon]